MAYQICKRCSKMFEKNGKLYCQSCFEKNQKEYDLIIKHVRNHPDANIFDIITETGVSLKSINCLVEDGGISYIEDKVNIKDKDESPIADDITLSKRNKFHITR